MANLPTSLRTSKHVFYIVVIVLSIYFLVMDIILYVTLKHSVLGMKKSGMYSPFRPLTVKLLMTDPFDHWIVSPLSEYFDEVTGFSSVFYFITPNMISVFHMFLTVAAGKLVTSPSLHTRRLAVLLYQMHDFLDGLDGVVYRARVGKVHLQRSNRSSIGYVVDGFCDTVGGTALCIGIVVYLFRNLPKKQHNGLPWTKSDLILIDGDSTSEKQNNNGHVSKFTAFFRTFSFGMQLLVAAALWDKSVERLSAILHVPLKDPAATAMQVELLHYTSTAIIFWIWRFCSAIAFLQMMLFSIFIDKIWEFLTFMLYVGWVFLFVAIFFTELHIRSLREKMHM